MRPQLEVLEERSEWVRSDIQEVLTKLCPAVPASIDNVELHMTAMPVDLPSSSATAAPNYRRHLRRITGHLISCLRHHFGASKKPSSLQRRVG